MSIPFWEVFECQFTNFEAIPFPQIFQNKGSVAIYLTLPDGNSLALINTHFPFDAESLTQSVLKKDQLTRQNAVFVQNIFFNEMYRKLVLEAPANPKYILLMGDLNYRIGPLEPLVESYWNRTISENYSNIKRERRKTPIIFRKVLTIRVQLVRWRKTALVIDSYSVGKSDQWVPSYCDRILYSTQSNEGTQLTCLEYNRFDYGVTTKSDHAAVMGMYSFGDKRWTDQWSQEIIQSVTHLGLTRSENDSFKVKERPISLRITTKLLIFPPLKHGPFTFCERQPQEEKDELNQVVINFILSYLESKGATLIDEKICVHPEWKGQLSPIKINYIIVYLLKVEPSSQEEMLNYLNLNILNLFPFATTINQYAKDYSKELYQRLGINRRPFTCEEIIIKTYLWMDLSIR